MTAARTTSAPRAASAPARLHLGVAAHGRLVPRWLASALDELAREGVVRLVAVIPDAAPAREDRAAADWLDARIARRVLRPEDDAWSPVPLPPCEPASASGIELSIAQDSAPPGSPPHAAWVVRFGSSCTRHRVELARGDLLLEIAIVAHDERGAERVLATTRTSAARSLTLSRNRAGWKAAALLARTLRAAALGRVPDAGSARAAAADPAPTRRGPGILASARRAVERLAYERAWRLAWRARATADDGPPDDRAWVPQHELVPPRGRFYADPFLLAHEGRECLFFEDFGFRAGRGRIACAELSPAGEAGTPRVVLAGGDHLSYPYVFAHEGRAFMIPETHARRTVELWRATSFPWTWERDRVLLHGLRAVDATWFEHGGLHWILACAAGERAPLSEELHAWWSSGPFGPWRPHEANPIVDDPRCARPAGRPFRLGPHLVRPAQDVLGEYGRRIVFRRIDVLDPVRYAESALSAFEARWLPGAVGAHTYDRSARHEVVDACTLRRRTALEMLGALP